MSARWNSLLLQLIFLAAMLVPGASTSPAATTSSNPDQAYENKDTRDLVVLVNDAADFVRARGEAAFTELGASGSRWRQDDSYIFILDPRGNMLVHPDPALEGMNTIDLKDVNGKPIVRGLIDAVTAFPDKHEAWYHYEWRAPTGLLPRWKSSYVRLVTAPSGKQYVVGAGMYNERMEKAFVVDIVNDAAGQIEKNPDAAFALFHDPRGPYLVKNAYIFVVKPDGVETVNPAFANLEGVNLAGWKDTQGKYAIREMLDVVKTKGSGWVNYMWPKPGESVSTQKSAYVTRAKMGDGWVVVGCGVYLADAPKAAARTGAAMTAPELMSFVRDGAALLQQEGEKAYPEFRRQDSRWFHGSTYIFIWSADGKRILNAANPGKEGRNDPDAKDVLGRPYGRMFLEAANSPSGEGWVHYLYPEPGGIFPTWKSTFVKRVTYPDGQQYIVGSGVYNMQMDKAFVQDVVNRASGVVASQGRAGFPKLRDKTGPFLFMDTYVFVYTPDGVEVVNPGQPSMEGTNILDLKDVNGKEISRELIAKAMENGSGWVDYYWYKPGDNTPTRKLTFVRKVQVGQDTYIVGSGLYAEEEAEEISSSQ